LKTDIGARFLLALLALAMLCPHGLSQENTSESGMETAENWYSRGMDRYENGSYQEALEAFEEGLEIDPQNATAWHYRGAALAAMGQGTEANQSLQKALEFSGTRLQENPKDADALWIRAEGMDLLGRSEEALEAYGRVTELNGSSYAPDAWIREADILAALGSYNQSADAFSKAMALLPANKSQTLFTSMRQWGETVLFIKAWIVDGQVHRVSIGLYNRSSKSFDEIEQVNSDLVKDLQLKDVAADPARHGSSLLGSSLNWDIFDFSMSGTPSPSWPSKLAMTRLHPVGDEFIEVFNGLEETCNLQNWSLEWEGSIAPLPEHHLLPGETVRIHLGRGNGNETDIFLGGSLELNDTAGSVSLIDDSGEDVATLDYRTELDGSLAYTITARGNFEYPAAEGGVPERGKMVLKTAGEGPFVTERAEVGQFAPQS